MSNHFNITRTAAKERCEGLLEKGFARKDTTTGRYLAIDPREGGQLFRAQRDLPKMRLSEVSRKRMAFEAHQFLMTRIPHYLGYGEVPIEFADLSDRGFKCEVADLPYGVSGQLNYDARLITISRFDRSEVRRFTLAHEYAHFVQLSYIRDMKLFSCQSLESPADEALTSIELEADWFAANLLLPTGPLMKFLVDSAVVFPSEENLVNKVAEMFNVSRSAAENRLRYLYFALISPGYLRRSDL